MYPETVPDASPHSERSVFAALESQLDARWLVFYSVAWQGIRHGRSGDGEADFVIAHSEKGVFVVEVKGGAVEIAKGDWISVSRNGRRHHIRNPFDQAVDSKYALRDYLDEQISGLGHRIRMGHLVAFPSVDIEGDLASEAPREIIWDRSDLAELDLAVGRVTSHWDGLTQLNDAQFEALRQALAPTRSIRRVLRHSVEDVVLSQVELTERQAQVFGFLRRQRRALITGGAGTGKTILALERARQLASEGRRVLLLCFNTELGEMFAEELAEFDGATGGSFHRLALDLVVATGQVPDGERDTKWWTETLPEALADAAAASEVSFDGIIIDEGQDFRSAWWASLELLLSDPLDGFMYVFADSHQDLYRTGWTPPFDGEPFVLDTNCRNTRQISERVNSILGTSDNSQGAEGPPPVFLTVSDPSSADEVGKRLEAILPKLLGEQEIKPSQVVVLTSTREMSDQVSGLLIGGAELGSRSESGIKVAPIYSFKGLESDVVIAILDEVVDEADLRLAYVGLSRARAMLFVIGSAASKEALSWD